MSDKNDMNGIVCPICGNTFTNKKGSKRQKYCSHECGYKGRVQDSINKLGVMEHVDGNLYRKKHMYKGRTTNRYYIKTTCSCCGVDMMQERGNSLKANSSVCSKECLAKIRSGPNNANFLGRKYKQSGHVLVYAPDHPNAKKNSYPEHRLVVEKHIGRLLDKKELVHHINMVKDDNRIENLVVFDDESSHFKAHGSLNRCVSRLLEEGVITFNMETLEYEVL